MKFWFHNENTKNGSISVHVNEVTLALVANPFLIHQSLSTRFILSPANHVQTHIKTKDHLSCHKLAFQVCSMQIS
jgi:PIN domain nuclease of toxin-antitoxin system